MSPFLKNLSQGGGGCGRGQELSWGSWRGDRASHQGWEELVLLSSGVCDTSDHVLAVSIFLLRNSTCSRECKPACCFLPHHPGVRALLLRCTGCCCCTGGFRKKEFLLCRWMSRIPLAEFIRDGLLCWVTGLPLNFIICSADL